MKMQLEPSLKNCVSVFVVAIVVAAGVARPGAQDPASAFESAAKEAEQAGRLKDAFHSYVRAEQALPASGEGTTAMRLKVPSMFDMDIRLRERIIALAPRVQPLPAVPEEAERFGIRGQVLFKDAKDKYGFLKAMFELDKAVHAAPWVPIYAFNLALVQEKLGYYKVAAANLKLYAASGAADAAEVRAKMFELELHREDTAAALSEDCDFFYQTTACLTRGRELSAGKDTSIAGEMMVMRACDLGSAEGCLEYGKAELKFTLEIATTLQESARLLKNKTTLGLETVQTKLRFIEKGCDGKLAAACRELGTFYAKDWPELNLKKNNKRAAEWYQRSCDLDPVANKVDCERAKHLR